MSLKGGQTVNRVSEPCWITTTFPSFQRRGGRAAVGVVSYARAAILILFGITNHPSAPLMERDLFIEAQRSHPLKTERNGAQPNLNSVPSSTDAF